VKLVLMDYHMPAPFKPQKLLYSLQVGEAKSQQ
jgi:hypothetical protein